MACLLETYSDALPMAVAFHEVVEEIKHYDMDSKMIIKDLVEQLIRDEQRERFVNDIREGMEEYKSGKLKAFHSSKELRADLDAD